MTRLVNRDRSLGELERDSWLATSGGETRLMATVRELRRKPIGSLTVEDMRLLIRQEVGLAYLLPLAIEVLRTNPRAEGDMYEGDLLAAVLTRSAELWSESPELRGEVRLIILELVDVPRPEARGRELLGSVAQRQQLPSLTGRRVSTDLRDRGIPSASPL